MQASVSQLATTTVVTPAVPKPVPRKEPKRVVTTVNKTNASSTTPNITIAHPTGAGKAPTATTNNTDTAVTAPATAATNNAGSLASDNVAATSNALVSRNIVMNNRCLIMAIIGSVTSSTPVLLHFYYTHI